MGGFFKTSELPGFYSIILTSQNLGVVSSILVYNKKKYGNYSETTFNNSNNILNFSVRITCRYFFEQRNVIENENNDYKVITATTKRSNIKEMKETKDKILRTS